MKNKQPRRRERIVPFDATWKINITGLTRYTGPGKFVTPTMIGDQIEHILIEFVDGLNVFDYEFEQFDNISKAKRVLKRSKRR